MNYNNCVPPPNSQASSSKQKIMCFPKCIYSSLSVSNIRLSIIHHRNMLYMLKKTAQENGSLGPSSGLSTSMSKSHLRIQRLRSDLKERLADCGITKDFLRAFRRQHSSTHQTLLALQNIPGVHTVLVFTARRIPFVFSLHFQ